MATFANSLIMDGGSSTMRSRSSSQKALPNYRLVKILGKGAYGEVMLALHILTGLKVAIKIIHHRTTRNFSAEKVRREFNIMRLFTHPHIVRLYEVIPTRSNIYVVMELMNSGDLLDYLNKNGGLQEDQARHFFQQIISGVEHCHLKRVVHRDLKLENLVLNSTRNVKIVDFGFSSFMRDGHFLKTSCGTPNYAAPELISGQLYAGPEVDVWSCGVILYALLCGVLPFPDEDITELYEKIKRGKYILPDHLSLGAKDLISRILVVNPVKRISIPEIRLHPWFQQHLPQYIAMRTTNNAIFDLTKKIDEEIVQEAVKIGFNMEIVTESVKKKLQNEATVTYFLLLDNRFQGNNSSLMIELLHRSQDQLDHPGIYLRSSPTLTQGNWAIGFQSRASPHRTMAGVLKVLERLNVRWKQARHYEMKCLWQSPFSTFWICNRFMGRPFYSLNSVLHLMHL